MSQSLYRNIANLRMRQFELLSTLAETGNMRRTAERLHISTAAVSKSLADIENNLGHLLFLREPKGLVPTNTGNLLVRRARLLLNEVSLLANDLLDEQQADQVILRVGAPPFLTWTLLPQLLAHFQQKNVHCTIQIVEGRLETMQQKLLNRELDLLVTMNTTSELGQLDQQTLKIHPIGEEHWVVACHPTHPAAIRQGQQTDSCCGKKQWAYLRQFSWILPPRPTQARLMFEQCLLDAGLLPVAPVIESTNASTNLYLIKAGMGLGFMPARTVSESLKRAELVKINLPPLPAIPLVLVHREDHAPQGLLAQFYEAARFSASQSSSLSKTAANK